MPQTEQLTSISGKDLQEIIPHRGQALRIDTVFFDPDYPDILIGQKTIDPYDFDLVGHLPDRPVYPGVLTLELASLTAIALMSLLLKKPVHATYYLGTDKTRNRNPAFPGDTLSIEVFLAKKRRDIYFFDATIFNQRKEIVLEAVNIMGTVIK